MNFRHTYKSIMTTIIGLMIIGLTLWNVYEKHSAWTDAAWGIAIGTGFLFAPDKIITGLRNFIDNKSTPR